MTGNEPWRCEALAAPQVCGLIATRVVITGTTKLAVSRYFCNGHLLERLDNFIVKYNSVIVARVDV